MTRARASSGPSRGSRRRARRAPSPRSGGGGIPCAARSCWRRRRERGRASAPRAGEGVLVDPGAEAPPPLADELARVYLATLVPRPGGVLPDAPPGLLGPEPRRAGEKLAQGGHVDPDEDAPEVGDDGSRRVVIGRHSRHLLQRLLTARRAASILAYSSRVASASLLLAGPDASREPSPPAQLCGILIHENRRTSFLEIPYIPIILPTAEITRIPQAIAPAINATPPQNNLISTYPSTR